MNISKYLSFGNSYVTPLVNMDILDIYSIEYARCMNMPELHVNYSLIVMFLNLFLCFSLQMYVSVRRSGF